MMFCVAYTNPCVVPRSLSVSFVAPVFSSAFAPSTDSFTGGGAALGSKNLLTVDTPLVLSSACSSSTGRFTGDDAALGAKNLLVTGGTPLFPRSEHPTFSRTAAVFPPHHHHHCFITVIITDTTIIVIITNITNTTIIIIIITNINNLRWRGGGGGGGSRIFGYCGHWCRFCTTIT